MGRKTMILRVCEFFLFKAISMALYSGKFNVIDVC